MSNVTYIGFKCIKCACECFLSAHHDGEVLDKFACPGCAHVYNYDEYMGGKREMSELDLKKELSDLSSRVDKAINAELKSKIDFSGFSDYVIKQGLLVEVRDIGSRERTRFFTHAEEKSGHYYAAKDGGHPSTEEDSNLWSRIRLLDNNPMPWFGGECPIPDGVRVRLWHRVGGDVLEPQVYSDDSLFPWDWTGAGSDIIAFQILESEWQ
jgi:hypothetical protein